MFGPWIEVYIWIKALLPHLPQGGLRKLKMPHLNFIMLHYIYMVSLTIIGSVILYGAGNLQYIDALFFASGAATQSGLNTVDVNLLKLYQQITLMLVACIANPIFINSFVVFVRLYWFEKRFQSIVLEARQFRRTRTKNSIHSGRSKSKADFENELDHDPEEKGVGTRDIRVLRASTGTIKTAEELLHTEKAAEESGSGDSSTRSGEDEILNMYPRHHDFAVDAIHKDAESPGGTKEKDSLDDDLSQEVARGITFVDQLRRETSNHDRLPQPRSAEQHIKFLENQRNPKDTGVLYIPGPRDFERGDKPKELNEVHGLSRSRTVDTIDFQDRKGQDVDTDRRAPKHALSWNVAASPILRAKDRVFSGFGRSNTQKTHTTNGDGLDDDPRAEGLRRRGRSRTFASFMSSRQNSIDRDPMPYLGFEPTIGRNSAFVNLTEAQREELGGIEYRTLKTLAIVLCCYFVGWHLVGMVCLVPWINAEKRWRDVVVADGQNPTWWGFFTSASMFNDLGFTLTPDSMISFQSAIFPLLIGSFLIIIGNTGFPCMLRFTIWCLSKVVPSGSALWEEFRFLLDHPRRCFTLLFPSNATWWLFWILVLLNGIDLLFFIILDLHDETITQLKPGIRVLDGWFQAASTRTAGFGVVNIADLHPAIQVSYLIMMYISVFPIAISVRRTNVYEEKSLGIYGRDEESEEKSYVGAHLRRQLSFDLWFIFMGLFIIAIVQGAQVQNNNEYAFTLFSILFEIVSAYGTVGLSLGYPNTNASFSAQFHVLSKLIIIAMQIRGRHRGLPYALDRAILLPSEHLQQREAEDADRRAKQRRRSTNQSGEGVFDPNRDDGDEDVLPPPAPRKRPTLTKLVSAALTAGPARKTKQ